MDKQRLLFVNEMKRIEEAIKKSKSEKLKKDYSRALKQMKKELIIYDRFRKEANEMKKR